MSALAHFALLALLAGAALAQDDPLLAKAKARVAQSVSLLPNYLCTQTIRRVQFDLDRYRYPNCSLLAEMKASERHLNTQDRLRLDVGVGGKTEMYAWAGEKKFNDAGILSFINYGPISSGSFTGFLRAVFTRGIATHERLGHVLREGRDMVEYSFTVARESHSYQVRSGDGRLIFTAYHGKFLLNAESGELASLTIVTDKQPEDGGACEQETSLQYTSMQMNGRDFLLPKESVLKIFHEGGMETENRTTYSACHVFLGESTISFEEAPASATVTKPALTQEVQIPTGANFSAVFPEEIKITEVFAGDTLKAKLKQAIKAKSGRTLVPAGSTVLFRVMKMQEFFIPQSTAHLEVRLDSLEADGKTIRTQARPVWKKLTAKEARLAPGLVLIGTLSTQNMELPNNTAVLKFVVTKAGRQPALANGFEMNWHVVAQ